MISVPFDTIYCYGEFISNKFNYSFMYWYLAPIWSKSLFAYSLYSFMHKKSNHYGMNDTF